MRNEIAAHLKEMLELSDEEIQEFMTVFLQSLDDCCKELISLRVSLDCMGLRRVTHTLIGFTENMGAMDVMTASRALNAAAKAADAPACIREIDHILSLQKAYHEEAGV